MCRVKRMYQERTLAHEREFYLTHGASGPRISNVYYKYYLGHRVLIVAALPSVPRRFHSSALDLTPPRRDSE